MERLTNFTNRFGVAGTLGLGFVLALLVGALAYMYLISPYQDEISVKIATAEASERNVTKLTVIAENREVVLSRGAEIYANYLKGSRLLPSGEQVSQVLEAIEGKAGANGSQVISFDAFKLGDKSSAAPGVSERVVEGELRGTHSALVGFLRSISYYERITEVRAISAVNDAKNGGGERLKFVLAAYYLPTQIEVPEEMRRRALDILAKEGFDLEQPVKVAAVATNVNIR